MRRRYFNKSGDLILVPIAAEAFPTPHIGESVVMSFDGKRVLTKVTDVIYDYTGGTVDIFFGVMQYLTPNV